jgi:hypothetical protein
LGSAVLAQQSPGEDLTCPLDKEVPVGQLINQMEYTNDRILRQMKNIDDAAIRLLQKATKLVESSDGCKTSNCQSGCRLEDVFVPRDGTPSTSCTAGYGCAYWATLKGDQASLSRLSCVNLPTGAINIRPERYYGLFHWKENQGFPCNPSSCQDPNFNPYDPARCSSGYACSYQNYNQTGQTIIDNGYSRQDCGNLPNNLTINSQATYAIYQWSKGSAAGWCNVLWPTTTCYGTCYNEGECSSDWTSIVRVCRRDACSGNACNFTEINAQMNVISQSTQTIDDSNRAIIDIFDKKVAELPFLGNICRIPGVGVLCNLKTEITTILSLFRKSLTNAKDCWNDPADYEKIISGEKSGKFLMSCEELSPGVLEKCYPNNFFCCK